jgi:hypothetical protein
MRVLDRTYIGLSIPNRWAQRSSLFEIDKPGSQFSSLILNFCKIQAILILICWCYILCLLQALSTEETRNDHKNVQVTFIYLLIFPTDKIIAYKCIIEEIMSE